LIVKTTYKKRYLSEHASQRVILHPLKQYELAEKLGFHPTIFNRAIHGSPVNATDKRWAKLRQIIRIPKSKLFE
jgi:hypothetical protein